MPFFKFTFINIKNLDKGLFLGEICNVTRQKNNSEKTNNDDKTYDDENRKISIESYEASRQPS